MAYGQNASSCVPLNNNFSYGNIFHNGVNALSKNGFEKPGFLSKNSKFCVVWTIRICSNFTSMWYKYFVRNVWRDFRISMLALTTVARKSFNGKFTAKIDFPIGHLMLQLLMLILKVSSFSIHYLISIWITGWWNLNNIVWSKLYKILSFLTKNGQPFLTKCWRHFGRHSCDWNNYCLMPKYWFKDYHLSSVPKITVVRRV